MIVRQPLFAAIALAAVFATPAVFAAGEAPAAAPAALAAPAAHAAPITKEQATALALKAHPGKVTKAYEDTYKGKKSWEIRITGDDGKEWETYYEITTGVMLGEKVK